MVGLPAFNATLLYAYKALFAENTYEMSLKYKYANQLKDMK